MFNSAQLAPRSNTNGLRQRRSGTHWTSPLLAFGLYRPRTRRHIEHSSPTYGSSGPVTCALQVSMKRCRGHTRRSGETEAASFWGDASVEIWNMRLSGDFAPAVTPGRCVRLVAAWRPAVAAYPSISHQVPRLRCSGVYLRLATAGPSPKNPHFDGMKKRGATPNDAPQSPVLPLSEVKRDDWTQHRAEGVV